MCGRFDLHTPRSWIAEHWFGTTHPVGDSVARYNTPPGTAITMIRECDGVIAFEFARWGYRPPWAGDDAPRPINAKAETVATSRYFRTAFQHQRCLIPANGWFEWKQGPNGKQPYYITQVDAGPRDVIFFAGIYSGSIETEFSVAILTEPAALNLQHIHARQPVVLDPGCRYDWLDLGITEREQIKQVTRRLNSKQFTSWPVTPTMNRPDHDDPSIIQPIE